MASKRNHKSTYQKRNERAQALGFKSYAEQRKMRKIVDAMKGISPQAKKHAKAKWKKDQIEALAQAHDNVAPDNVSPWVRLQDELEFAAQRDADLWQAFRKEYGRKR